MRALAKVLRAVADRLDGGQVRAVAYAADAWNVDTSKASFEAMLKSIDDAAKAGISLQPKKGGIS